MVKAKDFFKVLCEDLNYRFFSGIVCEGFVPLFKAMDKSFMHYVPAVNECTALGLTAGASISGLNSVLLLDMKLKESIYTNFNFIINNSIQFMLIGYSEDNKEDFKYKIPTIYFETLDDLKVLSNKMDKKSLPGLLIIGKDVVK